MTTRVLKAGVRGAMLLAATGMTLAAWATPVAVDWKASETAPVRVARPFHGFLADGTFLVAGGSDFEGTNKVYRGGVAIRTADGKWSKVGELPRPVAEGVCCETPKGVFCAGGMVKLEDLGAPDAAAKDQLALPVADAFLLTVENGASRISQLPPLPEPVTMGAAAADGTKVYVVASKKVYMLDVAGEGKWRLVGEILGRARMQHVAAIQNGDQKEKLLVVYGGYDAETRQPLRDGCALVLSQVGETTSVQQQDGAAVVQQEGSAGVQPASVQQGAWKKLASLPENTTTIGAAFLPSGHQHILLFGGYGMTGWVNKTKAASLKEAVEQGKASSIEAEFFREWDSCKDPVKLGWQRKILAYNAVTDAWCEYGELAEGDKPRCGAAAGLKTGKTPEKYTLVIAGGEVAPATRTDAVSVASFRKTGKFGAAAWSVVGGYALLMVAMACFFIFKKKDENDYFRGGNRIPWYVAGMSIFATMLSSITFIAIPTQAYLQDWRYFVMAFFIIGMAPVAIYYYLPFFCRLGITSAYEYLEKRFNLGVRLFGSAAFVVFMVCRVAVVTLLPAIALNAVTGISIDACILICGVLTMVYCSLGGLEAVIWSDFVQGIVLMGGAVSVLVLLIMKTGPAGAHFSTFWSVADTCGKTKMWDFRLLFTQPVFWVVAVS